jgi:hypothetical protein
MHIIANDMYLQLTSSGYKHLEKLVYMCNISSEIKNRSKYNFVFLKTAIFT